jgi:lactoylglutathione lyase
MGTTYITGHVGLNVTDLGRLVITLWQQAGGRLSPLAAGLHHLSFEVPTIDEVRAAERRLRAIDAEFAYDGIVPHAPSSTSGGIFFTDPDGIRLEIYAPTGAGDRPAPHSHAPTCGFF